MQRGGVEWKWERADGDGGEIWRLPTVKAGAPRGYNKAGFAGGYNR